MKMRQIVVAPPVTLPALSTDIPERRYSFMAFLAEWVMGLEVRGMRTDENLPYLFEWEDAINAFTESMRNKASVVEPTPPELPVPPTYTGPTEEAPAHLTAVWLQTEIGRTYLEQLSMFHAVTKPLIEAHNQALEAYRKSVEDAAEGESFTVSEQAFQAAKTSAKAALDKASERGPKGPPLHPAYEPKVLRHYHALAQSKLV